MSHTYLAIHDFFFPPSEFFPNQNTFLFRMHCKKQFRSYICLCLYLCVPVHELVPQDWLMSTNNSANDDDLDVSMFVNKIANDEDQGNRFTSVSICSDQLVDEEESSTYKRTLTTILMCLRSAGGSEVARYTSSQDTLFCYVNSKFEPH